MSSKFKSVEGMLTSVDSLFTTQAERDDMAKPKVEEISLDLIDGFEVFRDYKVKIDFNFDFEQFTQGLDIAA